jgi:hypothetical protein
MIKNTESQNPKEGGICIQDNKHCKRAGHNGDNIGMIRNIGLQKLFEAALIFRMITNIESE